MSQHIEKALDDHGHGCVAAADIAAFFDNLDPIRVLRWLIDRGFPRALAAALFRIHCLPVCQLQLGNMQIDVGRRSSGFFTGTRSAGTAARIPLLDAAGHRAHVWNQFSFRYSGMSFSLTSFVDNVFTAASDLTNATTILNDLENFLRSYWGLRFGEASREILTVDGLDIGEPDVNFANTWAIKQSMRCLGHILTSNGSIEDDFNQAKTSMWAVFWVNYRSSLMNAPKEHKFRFLQGCVAGIARFKWSRWPWQVTYAQRLDQVQTHMVSLLFPCAQFTGEPPEDYFRRRSLISGRRAATMGKWSLAWATSVNLWHSHCQRAHDRRNWNSFIYNYRGEGWLSQRRAWNSRSGESRTNTRATHGKVTRRYHEGQPAALFALSS